jgi:exonuclease SbcD
VPLRDRTGSPRALCVAIPHLRAGDLPGYALGGAAETGDAVRRLVAGLAAEGQAAAAGLPLIGMAHLTCAGGTESEGAERRILIGGEQAVPPDIFPPSFVHVALGHLHRPQALDGGRLRYSGSLFPLSLSEIGYRHGLSLLELGPAGLAQRSISLPRPVPMLHLPGAESDGTTGALARALAAAGLDPATPRDRQPFLHARLRAGGPAATVRAEAEALVAAHPVRLAGLVIEREAGEAAARAPARPLSEIDPEDLFRTAFHAANGAEPGPEHLAAFRDAWAEV